VKKFIKKHRVLIFCLAVPYIIIILFSIIHINYDVVSPASIDEIEDVIEISTESPLNGSINVVSVYSYERVSILNYLIAKLNPYATIDKSSDYVVTNYDDMILGGTWQKRVSLNNAIIAGYKAAGYDLDYDFVGYVIHSSLSYLDDNLKIGDIITHINGEELSNDVTPSSLLNKYKDLMPSIEFTVIKNYQTKNEKTLNVLVKATEFNNEFGKYYAFGFSAYALNYPKQNENAPSFRINWNNVKSIGPSGGLLQGFYVYEKLTDAHLSSGLKIAGTGKIDLYGNAGLIGGMRQKIFTAELSGVDVFFVPVTSKDYLNDSSEVNYIEAKNAYDSLKNPHMRLVPVWSLDEIIKYLTSYKEEH